MGELRAALARTRDETLMSALRAEILKGESSAKEERHPPVMSDEERADMQELRRRSMDRLRDLQMAVLSHATDRSFIQLYAGHILERARAVLAARTCGAAELADMQVAQLEAVWWQVARNLRRRTYAFVGAVGLFALLVVALVWLSRLGALSGAVGPIGPSLLIPMLGVPLYVVLWSAIGSVSAVLYRVNRASDTDLEDPLRLLITRPFIGVIMGTVSYLIVQLGVVTLANVSGAPAGGAPSPAVPPELHERTVFFLSFVSFLVGFSDRLADALLRSLAGRLGGPTDGELVADTAPKPAVDPLALTAAVDTLEKRRMPAVAPRGPGAQERREEHVREHSAPAPRHAGARTLRPDRRPKLARSAGVTAGQHAEAGSLREVGGDEGGENEAPPLENGPSYGRVPSTPQLTDT